MTDHAREYQDAEARRSPIVLFLVVTFLFWVTLYLYVPTLPTYVKARSSQLSTVGLVLSMYGLFMAAARLPMGILGDVLGWGKPLIAVGVLFAAAGAFVMGRGSSLGALAAGRALTGVSAGTWVILTGVFSSFFAFDQAIYASSLLFFAASFGRMISTSLTGSLNRIGGYPLAFYCAALTGLVAVILSLLVTEQRRPPQKVSLRSIGLLMVRKDVILPTVISILLHYADWAVTFGFFPILAQEMGVSDVLKSVLISCNIAAITAASLMNALFLKGVSHRFLLMGGAFLFFVGMQLIALSPGIAFLFLGTVSMGFAFGTVYPILLGMSIQKVDRAQRTSAMGIHQSFYAIGMFTGPWLSGIAADRFGIRPTFMITSLSYVALVYAVIYLLFRKKDEKVTGPDDTP
jgi:DHA1 family multidrug resistance protein-like MFS transporter